MKTLIIEDHPTMVEGYKSILSLAAENIDFKFSIAKNCTEAVNEILRFKFDLILLDINIPAMDNSEYRSGFDVAFLIKREMPNCKILILTSHIEKIVLYSIAKEINPNGLMVKSDFSPEELVVGIRKVIAGENVLTQSVYDSVKEINRETVYLDSTNRKILQLLNEGIMTKNLTKYLELSQSAIDKRKSSNKRLSWNFQGLGRRDY